jgi:hypothetical protein
MVCCPEAKHKAPCNLHQAHAKFLQGTPRHVFLSSSLAGNPALALAGAQKLAVDHDRPADPVGKLLLLKRLRLRVRRFATPTPSSTRSTRSTSVPGHSAETRDPEWAKISKVDTLLKFSGEQK